ncbi:MAG TPA: hypothetical protein VLN45_09700, partial [Ignavibacteriaceae bacterium]|nr:hypothetical protein [Ignavibacteriaceae bacterium]
FMGDDVKGGKKSLSKIYKQNATTQSGKHGDSYRLNINNINMPLGRNGDIAAVNITDPDPQINGAGGKFGGQVFLFASGFFLSGISNGTMFANAVASASLVNDYIPGTVESPNDPNAVMYVVKGSDEPFGESWQDWRDAVGLGADFYDGDHDGIYDPVDKNGNSIWDLDEDSPDILGDETVWCVYNDGVPGPQRRWNAVDPVGIEVRQTVFALLSKGPVGNIIFVRYRIKYAGLGTVDEPNQLDDMYFGVWADPDLGTAEDDRIGSDTLLNAGYTYNPAADALYGANPPSFFIDFFQGPLEYIPGVTFTDTNGNGNYDPGVDTPLDTAYSVRGRRMNPEGPVPFEGARNQPLSSFVLYINGDPDLNDPNNHEEARNYSLGTTRTGQIPNPCSFAYGNVVGGVDCEAVNPQYWFSGDPVTNVGWLCTVTKDVRQMSNTGPFTLYKDTQENRDAGKVIEKEIVVAYVVGQGTDHLSSITEARKIDELAQGLFNSNFPSLPPPPPFAYEVKTGSDFIDISWPTRSHLIYSASDSVLDVNRWEQGFYITAFRSNNKQQSIEGLSNAIEVARYTLDNQVNNVYVVSPNGGQDLKRPIAEASNLLDSTIYTDPSRGRIRFRMNQDPFTGGPLIKGKEYYFALTQYTLNHNVIVHRDSFNVSGLEYYGPEGDYLDPLGTALEEFETPIIKVTFGEDLYDPALSIQEGGKISGGSNGTLQYDVINKEELTGNKYQVTFFVDSSSTSSNPTIPSYSTYWRLENTTTGQVIKDSSKEYLYGSTDVTSVLTEGFITKISSIIPDLADQIESETATDWHNANFYYLNTDMGSDSKRLPGGGNAISNLNNDFTCADKLRRVELRFGEQGKAYRYLNGFVGAAVPLKRQSYVYAGGVINGTPGVNPADLVEIGQLGIGYVDVPFTAWVDDPAFGETRQLAVGILERKISEGGTPDGIWNPGQDVNSSGEYIFIFDATYDPTGSQMEYQGNFPASQVVWADLKGYTIPTDANATDLQRKIASSHFFNVLYAVGISDTLGTSYSNEDKFIIDVVTYPYSSADVFEFQTKQSGALTSDEEKALFEKVNVFPNPLYGYNVATSYTNSPADEPFVTFSNLPEEVSIKIYTLSGTMIRELGTVDKTSPTSPFVRWNLENENGLRVASGLYLAIVSSPGLGEKVLKFSVILPQKQLPRY